MKLYTYPTCTTSKRAREFLRSKGAKFTEVDMKGGLAADELRSLIGDRDVTEFFNPRNPVFREKDIKTNPPPIDEAIRLLAADPRAIRRPMLVKKNKIIFGFDPAKYEEMI